MVKAIIFDCFGVLTTDLWKEFMAALPAKQIEAARYLNYQYDSGVISQDDFVREVVALTGRPAADVRKIFAGGTPKNEELLSYIAKLKRDYKVGLLSNVGSNWVRSEFLDQSEQALFDSMILSYEVHMAKPDPEIFELAAEKLGIKPTDCVFIDDSEGHCAAAAARGMRTVVYGDFQQMKDELAPLLRQS